MLSAQTVITSIFKNLSASFYTKVPLPFPKKLCSLSCCVESPPEGFIYYIEKIVVHSKCWNFDILNGGDQNLRVSSFHHFHC